MSSAFDQSRDAYNRGDHAAAKQFSTQGKEHQRKMEEYNQEASDWIFKGSSREFHLSLSLPLLFRPGSNDRSRSKNTCSSLRLHTLFRLGSSFHALTTALRPWFYASFDRPRQLTARP